MATVNITFNVLDIQDDRAEVEITGNQTGPGEATITREIVWGDYTQNISDRAQNLEEYLDLLSREVIPARFFTESEEPGNMRSKINNLVLKATRTD